MWPIGEVLIRLGVVTLEKHCLVGERETFFVDRSIYLVYCR
jgi:hypothetical protein